VNYLNGIDISKWQPTTPSLAGQSFAFARATYATTVDPKYAMHVANFRKAGLVVGAYHFGVGFVSVPAQVKAFLTASKGADLLILDLERDSTKTMTQAEARAFIKAVQATGKKIGLYHSRSGFPSLGQDYNWIAQWRKEPPTGIPWAFWQWQGSPLDRDKFNGDKAALLELAGKTPAPIPPKEAPVATGNRLTDAIVTRAGYLANELAAGDDAGALLQIAKINEFNTRILVSIVGSTVDVTDPDEALSPLPAVAIHQILAATGHPTTIGETGGTNPRTAAEVIADATPEQQRELALLGFFAQPGAHPVDYSLFEQYYVNDGQGNWAPKDPDKSAWATYLASKG
jgi:hypothetical protein